jgi:hypothetical protein
VLTSETKLSASNNKEIDRLHRIIMPCAEVTRLLSDPAAPPLTCRQRIALRVHLAICSFCSRYKHQLHRLRLALRRDPADADTPVSQTLSPEARERIRRSLPGKPR